MHVVIRASSVYVKSWTVPRPELSSTLTADFVNAAEFIDVVDLISAAKFDTIPLCHSSNISLSLGQSIVQTYRQPLLMILLTLSNSTLLLNLSTLSIPTLCTFRQRTSDEFNPVTNLPHQKKLVSSLNLV